MNNNLLNLKKRIFFGKNTDEEWCNIEKQVKVELEQASESDRDEFIDSGACGILNQILEYMD